jgi:hypothetical protein
VLTLTSVREVPDDKLLHDLLQKASELVHPPTVWDGLTAGPPFHAAARPSP